MDTLPLLEDAVDHYYRRVDVSTLGPAGAHPTTERRRSNRNQHLATYAPPWRSSSIPTSNITCTAATTISIAAATPCPFGSARCHLYQWRRRRTLPVRQESSRAQEPQGVAAVFASQQRVQGRQKDDCAHCSPARSFLLTADGPTFLHRRSRRRVRSARRALSPATSSRSADLPPLQRNARMI